MNILFYTPLYPNPLSGGVEHSTYKLYRGLSEEYNYSCYILYSFNKFNVCNLDSNIALLPNSSPNQQISFIQEYVKKNNIQVIIVQGDRNMTPVFYRAIGQKIPLVHVFREEPAFPYKTWTIEYIKALMSYRNLVAWGRKRLLKFPLRKIRMRWELYKNYHALNKSSDFFVFLSKHYIREYKWYAFSNVEKKSFIIPNSVCYKVLSQESIMRQKQKRVLIVSRFDEYTKRIIAALEVWNLVQNKYHLDDWILDVVGDGDDKDLYESYLQKHQVNNIVFHGYQNPIKYYQSASILMLTSRCEAFANVLLEAQQYGCVPIAFRSYAAVTDIVTHQKDGILVKNGNIVAFAKTLYELAIDDTKRTIMARTAMQSVMKFSQEINLMRWNNTLNIIYEKYRTQYEF